MRGRSVRPEGAPRLRYLLECHGRHSLRQATEQYQHAIELDPDADRPRYQLSWAQAAFGEIEEAIALYTRCLAGSPHDAREHRFLARAYLAARHYAGAGRVIAAGLALAPDDRLLLETRGEARADLGERPQHEQQTERSMVIAPQYPAPVDFLLLRDTGVRPTWLPGRTPASPRWLLSG